MDMRTTGMAVVAALALGSGAAFGQDARTVEVLAKTRSALGGATLDAMRTFSLEAETERNVGPAQMAGEVELLLDLPDKYLKSEESRVPMPMLMTSGFNGEKAIIPAGASMGPGGAMMVIRMGPGGPPAPDAPKMTDEQKQELNAVSLRNARVELSRLMLGWFASAHPSLNAKLTYAGEAESPDGRAHVIDVTGADGFEARLFINQNNHLPLMVTYKARAPRMVTSTGPREASAHGEAEARRQAETSPLVEFALYFDDWRQVTGITFPHVLRRASAGETVEEWTISKVAVNPAIDAKRFADQSK